MLKHKATGLDPNNSNWRAAEQQAPAVEPFLSMTVSFHKTIFRDHFNRLKLKITKYGFLNYQSYEINT